MKLLLSEYKCNINIEDFYGDRTLFCWFIAHTGRDDDAFNMILDYCIDDIDINKQNNLHGTTAYGLKM